MTRQTTKRTTQRYLESLQWRIAPVDHSRYSMTLRTYTTHYAVDDNGVWEWRQYHADSHYEDTNVYVFAAYDLRATETSRMRFIPETNILPAHNKWASVTVTE